MFDLFDRRVRANLLAIGAVTGCLNIFSRLTFFSFSLSLGNGPIYTEIPSQRAFKQTNKKKICTDPNSPFRDAKVWSVLFFY